jgi:alkanesulfonate monooxygenase SsuD/methylene tetrahydromethanopterin reductase-like flavin-dependent oxidoreductase (luciferase family)
LMMECDFREGRTQREAFDEALATTEAAEALGFDGVWLAERHFAAPGGAAPVSSIGSAPLLLATAIATRTSRLRVGTAVLLLPLGHPVRPGRGSRHAGSPEPRPPRPRDWSEQFPPIL